MLKGAGYKEQKGYKKDWPSLRSASTQLFDSVQNYW